MKRRWGWLVGYGVVLGGAIGAGVLMTLPEVSIWDAQDSSEVVRWGEQLVEDAVWQLGAFCVLGVLTGWAVWGRRGEQKEQKKGKKEEQGEERERVETGDGTVRDERCWPNVSVIGWLGATAIALGLTVLVACVPVLRWPTVLRLLAPSLGCVLGVWIAWWWRGSWIARLALAVQLVVLACLVVAGGGCVAARAIEPKPLAFTPANVTSAEKRRLVQLLRNGGQRDADVRRVTLTEHDVNLLLNWGLGVGAKGRKAKATFEDGSANGMLSVAVPVPRGRRGYVNALAAGKLAAGNGQIDFQLDRLKVGSIEVPGFVLGWISYSVVDVLNNDPDLGEVVRSTRRLTIKPDAVEIVARRGLFKGHISPRLLARVGAKPDVVAATRQYVRHLVDVAPQLPRGDQRFTALVRAAFHEARERSVDSDPVLENRAAILALSILLGHPRVEKLVGQVTDHQLRTRAGKAIGRVPLRGRTDWTKHFWVSAAVALLSNTAVSDAVGQLKEELDAGRGGSGFSFSDLLADMAGTRFALYVTRDPETARAVQQQLAAGVSVGQLFPPAADLPEGIPDARLLVEYGGVDGAGYRRMIRELERRLGEAGRMIGAAGEGGNAK